MSAPGSASPSSLLTLLDRRAWHYFLRFFQQQGKRLVMLSFIASLRSLLLVPILLMVREIFDVAIPTADQGLLLLLAAGIIGARLCHSGILILMRLLIVKDIQGTIKAMRGDLLAQLYRLNRGFYARTDKSTLQARIVQDTARVEQMCNALFSSIIPSLFTGAVLLGLLFILQWQLTLFACLVVPIVLLTNKIIGRRVQQRITQFQQAFEGFSRGTQFSLRYMDLTQEQGVVDRELSRRQSELDELGHRSEQMSRGYLLSGQLNDTIMTVMSMVVVVTGAMAIMTSMLTLGEFVAFYAAAGMLNGQLSNLTSGLPELLTGNASLQKLQALGAETARHPYSGTKPDKKSDKKPHAFHGQITFTNVSFSYDNDPLLNDISLDVIPGKTLVITGRNGAGKSTLLQLLMGFWRPDTGQVLADGVPYQQLHLGQLRAQLGFVPQRPDIFAGTIRDNIVYGHPEASDEAVMAAARLSGAHEFISQLPEQYQTGVGDDGCKLSGGERQKLAIARAMISRPALLVLDEPTNHLDHQGVDELLVTLKRQCPAMALVIVSHDQRVAECADRVIRLEDARLVDIEPVDGVNNNQFTLSEVRE